MFLVTHPGYEPFLTDVFDPENNYIEGMVVYHFTLNQANYTTDGTTWQPIPHDEK